MGIDLAGVAHRETGVAVLRGGRLELLTSAGDDEEILALARRAGRWGTVAINAPLTRPLGRCCLDDDCPCRRDPQPAMGRRGAAQVALSAVERTASFLIPPGGIAAVEQPQSCREGKGDLETNIPGKPAPRMTFTDRVPYLTTR